MALLPPRRDPPLRAAAAPSEVRLTAQPIVHHDLCFGCGRANLFGLQLEGNPDAGGDLIARFFVKQDHQGPPGFAHSGIVATALEEAMALALHAVKAHAEAVRLEIDFRAPVPVGGFLVLSARVDERVEERGEGSVRLSATATADAAGGAPLAEAVGVFRTIGAMESRSSLG